ncbi:amidase [candidate division KSB1 bacterium]|nr:amidase [candidate division KSB1 bacterium]
MSQPTNTSENTYSQINRRDFFTFLTAMGIIPAVLSGEEIPVQEQETSEITEEVLQYAEKIFGIPFTDDERELMLRSVVSNREKYEKIRQVTIDNAVSPAITFSALLPGMQVKKEKNVFKPSKTKPNIKSMSETDIAFLSVTHLSQLIKSRQISSMDLTKLYLKRLKKYNEKLHCVITFTEELALAQAKKADEEIRVGHYRGPLHGIPWGVKDLFAVKDYRTTWGATPFKEQKFNENATIVERLNEAGAVLLAKTSLGALAWGDVWFGEKTRNPWDPEQGSSGSSAGSASATSAGLVGFSIGTETLGSIVSPCTRCGVTGLRPTFGRVSRYGAMALSWSMDKAGPICRSVEDTALVLHAIHGGDDKDASAVDFPFHWNAKRKVSDLKIGYLKSAFDDANENSKPFNDAVLDVIRKLGVKLIPIEWPDIPYGELGFILSAEAATAFDEITWNKEIDTMVRQGRRTWPNSFRSSRFIPAVEYIQANRLRTMVMQKMAEVMSQVDVVVTPSFGGGTLLLTNLTGHPAVVLPNGFRENGAPVSISFIGNLFKESDLLIAAKAYQDATDFHLQHPKMEV